MPIFGFMIDRVGKSAAPVAAVLAAGWWAIGLTVLQPLTEPEKPWHDLWAGNNTYWARDVRWVMIMLVAVAVIWACHGDARLSSLAVLGAVAWLGLDTWLDRIDLAGTLAAVVTGIVAVAAVGLISLATRLRTVRPNPSIMVSAATVAGVLALHTGIESPTDTEAGLTWSGLVIGVLASAIAIGCAAQAGPAPLRSLKSTIGYAAVAGVLVIATRSVSPGAVRLGLNLLLVVIVVTAVLSRSWGPSSRPTAVAGRAGLAAIVVFTILFGSVIVAFTLDLGSGITMLAGNPPINSADEDPLMPLISAIGGLIAGLVFAAVVRGGDRHHVSPDRSESTSAA